MDRWLSVMAAAEEEAQAHGTGIATETLFHIGPIPVSNTIFSAWVVMAVLLLLSWAATRNMKAVPTGLQNVMELVVESWMGIVEKTAGPKGRRFLPLVLTAFLFILMSNWIGTTPLFGNTFVGPEGHRVEVFRSPNSDLNVTVAMAIIVFLTTQAFAVRAAGVVGYLREFLIPNPLHIVTELSRPLSLSLRLFGNIFAGSTLVHTMLGLAPYATFVFLGLELFVGVIQALIFSILTLVFLSIATSHEHGEAHEHGEHGEAAASEVADADRHRAAPAAVA